MNPKQLEFFTKLAELCREYGVERIRGPHGHDKQQVEITFAANIPTINMVFRDNVISTNYEIRKSEGRIF